MLTDINSTSAVSPACFGVSRSARSESTRCARCGSPRALLLLLLLALCSTRGGGLSRPFVVLLLRDPPLVVLPVAARASPHRTPRRPRGVPEGRASAAPRAPPERSSCAMGWMALRHHGRVRVIILARIHSARQISIMGCHFHQRGLGFGRMLLPSRNGKAASPSIYCTFQAAACMQLLPPHHAFSQNAKKQTCWVDSSKITHPG